MSTHDVTNQPPPLEGYNLFAEDRALGEALDREGAGWARERVARFGAVVGGEPMRWGELANTHEPELRTYDRFGHRIDEVDYHPRARAVLGFSFWGACGARSLRELRFLR